MKPLRQATIIAFGLLILLLAVSRIQSAPPQAGAAAKADAQNGPFFDAREARPGKMHKITAADLPAPYATPSGRMFSRPVPRPADVWPQAPAGFKVQLYADQLRGPRTIVTAPNGDLFVVETNRGDILVFRGVTSDGKYEHTETFATGLRMAYGMAFYPLGPNPKYLYVGNTDAIIRFPYENGDMKARGPSEVVVPNLPGGPNHSAKLVAFSLDGKRMFISVGSHNNVTDIDTDQSEFHRANILVANPDGSDLKVFATGIRSPVGLGVHPRSGELWVSVNERDELGDNLPPDYITHVQEGGFYGWPWYYTGGNQDPRFPGKHPELKDKVIGPDVLVGPHFASLNLTFYEGKQFPKEYQGSIFAAEHGSWNRSARAGYEVVFVPLDKKGRASGEFMDFLTGFVLPDGSCWGRPVGVAVAQDGSLMVTDDGSNSIWRVTYSKK